MFRHLPTAVWCAAGHVLIAIVLLIGRVPVSDMATICGWASLCLSALALGGRFFHFPARILLVAASCCLAVQRTPQIQQLNLVEARPVRLQARVLEWHHQDDGDWAIFDRLTSVNETALARSNQRLLGIAASGMSAAATGTKVHLEGRLNHDGYHFRLEGFRWESRDQGRAPPLTILRNWVRLRLQRALSSEAAGLASALLLGERRDLPVAMQDHYRRFGLVHLLAVSGLHFWLWDQLLRRLLGHKLAFMRWPLLLLAAGLANASAPVVRACSVVLLRDSCARLGWQVRGLHLWSAAWCIEVALLAPRIAGLGFVLSYTATAFLIIGCPRRDGLTPVNALRASWVAFLGSMPILHAVQATIEPWTIPLSPMLACLKPLRLLASLLALVPGLGGLMNLALIVIGRGEDLLFELIKNAPASPWCCPELSSWALLATAVIGLIICRRWQDLAPPWRLGGVALMLTGIMHTARSDPGISALQVGHGLAVVIAGKDASMCFDLGSGDVEPNRLVDRIVVPELGQHKWPMPKFVVRSHGDVDHVNGLPFLAQRQAFLEVNCQPGRCHRVIDLQPFEVRVIGCRPALNGVANDGGHVLEVTAEDVRVVLLGDQSGYSLRQLREHLRPGPIDILLIPHHGLTTDGLAELLQYLRPQVAWTSSGPRNYPLPARPLLEYFGVPLRSTLEQSIVWHKNE